jgi:signal transduction histidine kinase
MLRFDVASQEVPEGGRARRMLEDALKSADTILLEGRDRVRSLRSDTFKDLTLAEALAAVGTHLTRYSEIRFHVQTEGPMVVVNPIVLEEVFCIGREAITNAFQHADPSVVEVRITYGKNAFVVSCRDDGKGLDPMLLSADGRPGHWGLIGMKERATKIGSKFECISSTSNGTRITVTVPANQAYGVRSPIMRLLLRYLPWLRS